MRRLDADRDPAPSHWFDSLGEGQFPSRTDNPAGQSCRDSERSTMAASQ